MKCSRIHTSAPLYKNILEVLITGLLLILLLTRVYLLSSIAIKLGLSKAQQTNLKQICNKVSFVL